MGIGYSQWGTWLCPWNTVNISDSGEGLMWCWLIYPPAKPLRGQNLGMDVVARGPVVWRWGLPSSRLHAPEDVTNFHLTTSQICRAKDGFVHFKSQSLAPCHPGILWPLKGEGLAGTAGRSTGYSCSFGVCSAVIEAIEERQGRQGCRELCQDTNTVSTSSLHIHLCHLQALDLHFQHFSLYSVL
jgi:hypothetical protein